MKSKDYRIAGPKSRDRILKYIKDADILAYDVETKGNNVKTAEIIGFAFTDELDNGWYLPLYEWDIGEEFLCEYPTAYWNLAEEILLELKKKDLVMHNGVFDVITTRRNFDIDLIDALYADTILMKHTIDEEQPHGLEACVQEYEEDILLEGESTVQKKVSVLHENVKKNGGSLAKDNYQIWKADLDMLAEYGVADVYLTLRLFYLFEDILEEEGKLEFFYKQEVMPLNHWGTVPMQYHGVPIDVEYYESLKEELKDGIMKLEQEAYELIQNDIEPIIRETIQKKVNKSRSGDFAKAGLRYLNIPVPITNKGKETLSAKALEKLREQYDCPFLQWLAWNPKKDPEGTEPVLDDELVYNIKKEAYFTKNPGDKVFNFRSRDHISWLLFEKYGCEVNPEKLSKKTKKPSVDEEVLKENSHLPVAEKLLKIRKEEKILGTYVEGILKRRVGNFIYPRMQQYGTTSGRYSCQDPNFQNLPRDDTRVKKGIKAPEGYKIVNADFSSLEPRCFTWVTQDPELKKIFTDGLDFYSKIAIDVLKAEGVSADPNAENFLKKKQPDLRQKVKTFALSVPYGVNAFKLHMETGRPMKEHQQEIDDYLEAYPGLKNYMRTQEEMAYTLGYVETRFGRKRRIPLAKELYDEFGDDIFNKMKMALNFAGPEGEDLHDEYQELRHSLRGSTKEQREEIKEDMKEVREEIYELGKEGCRLYAKFRNCMNNAKNSPIQMSAAHACNAAMIKYSKALHEHGIDGWVMMQIHDEVASIIREDQAERAAELLKDAMENNWVTERIDIPILAEPEIANTFDEAK